MAQYYQPQSTHFPQQEYPQQQPQQYPSQHYQVPQSHDSNSYQQLPSRAYPQPDNFQRPQPPPRANSYPHAHPLPYQPPQNLYSPQPPPGQLISAPSPQYPPYYPPQAVVSHANLPPQISQIHSNPDSLFRRPLPIPGVSAHPPSSFPGRPPLPTPVLTPIPAPSSSRNPAIPQISQPQSPTSPSVISPVSPGTSSRRPLPNPIPRSQGAYSLNSNVRSPSPVRAAVATFSLSQESPRDASSSTPTGFVPYWKRNAASPIASGSAPLGQPWSAGSNFSAGSDRMQVSSGRDRSKSMNTGRPLPPSPIHPPNIGALNLGSPLIGGSASSTASRRPRALPDPMSPSAKTEHPPHSRNKMTAQNGRSESPTKEKPAPQTASPRATSPTEFSFALPRAAPPVKSNNGFNLEGDKDGDKNILKSRSPSPQYGIRDLPARSRSVIYQNELQPQQTTTDRDKELFSRARPARSSTLPQPPTPQSLSQTRHWSTHSTTLGSNPVSPPVQRPNSRSPGPSTPTSPSNWPSGLPPLPRAPGSGFTKQYIAPSSQPREYVNLDDAPPPSLRRSPSPSASSRSPAPSPKLPTFRTSAPSNSYPARSQNQSQNPPALPPRRGMASNPPSPKKMAGPLPPLPHRREPASSSSGPRRQASPQLERERKPRFVEPAQPIPKISLPGDPDGELSDDKQGAADQSVGTRRPADQRLRSSENTTGISVCLGFVVDAQARPGQPAEFCWCASFASAISDSEEGWWPRV
ncbi:hypothetical protein EW146_g332 [Bondarzewia mesenterica]|uniref:Uncharacterized protein n=1 Tax=Bondarzewia mesenterica TaxID=1095465 RepID=A0A4S4M9J1_9AGAM|nr:hypothetical protein EW146_g332 [Bondarzewia mesenterica]